MNRPLAIIFAVLGALALQGLLAAHPVYGDTTTVTISTTVIQGLPSGPAPNATITYTSGGQQETTTVTMGSSISLSVDVNSNIYIQNLISVSSTERYVVSGSGQFNSGSGSSVTFSYSHQYLLTIQAPSYASATGGGWKDAGSTATFSVDTPVSIGASVRYVFLNWVGDYSSSSPYGSILMDEGKTITANYETQYYLAVAGGSSPSGSGWYDYQSIVRLSSAYVWGLVSGQSRNSLVSWQLDSTTTNIDRLSTGTFTVSVVMNAPHSVTFKSVIQYPLTVNGGNNVAYSVGSQTGDGWYDSGTVLRVSSDYTWAVTSGRSRTNLVSTRIDNAGVETPRRSSGTFTTPSITISSSKVVSFVSTVQYYFLVRGGNNIAFAPASPTSDRWFDERTSIRVSTDNVWNSTTSKRLNLVSWTLNGVNFSVKRSGEGSMTTPSILADNPQEIVFNDVTQYRLSVAGGGQIAYSAPSPTADNWFDVGTTLSVSTSYVWNEASGTRLNLISWSLDGGEEVNVTRSGKGVFTTSDFSMTKARKIGFNPVTQFLLTIQSNVSSAKFMVRGSQTGDNWFDSGTTASFTVAESVLSSDAKTRYVLIGWEGEGDSSYSGPEPSPQISMMAPVTERALWKTQYLISFYFTDFEGEVELRPSSIGLVDPLGKTRTLTNTSYFADIGSSWTVSSVIWQSVNVADNVRYTVTKPDTMRIRLHTYQVEIVVRDLMRLPVSGALVSLTFANNTNVAITTDASGVAYFGYVPFGTFKGFVNFMGDFSTVSADTEGSHTLVSSVTLSYPLMVTATVVEVMAGLIFFLASPKLYGWRFRLSRRR